MGVGDREEKHEVLGRRRRDVNEGAVVGCIKRHGESAARWREREISEENPTANVVAVSERVPGGRR